MRTYLYAYTCVHTGTQGGVWWGYISNFLVIINHRLVTLSSVSLSRDTEEGRELQHPSQWLAEEIKELTQPAVLQTPMYKYRVLFYLDTKTMFLKNHDNSGSS